MPGIAAIRRHLDTSNYTPDIGCGAGHGYALTLNGIRRGNLSDRRRRCRMIARLGRDLECGLQRRGLHAHVCKQVDHRLLYIWIGRRLSAVSPKLIVIVGKPPRPEDRACAKYQRAADRDCDIRPDYALLYRCRSYFRNRANRCP